MSCQACGKALRKRKFTYKRNPWGPNLHTSCLRRGVVCELDVHLPADVMARLPHVKWASRKGRHGHIRGLLRYYWKRCGQGVPDEDTVDGCLMKP